jgi:hypothetical protein
MVNEVGCVPSVGTSAVDSALEMESAAKRRLADEYDAAQERGEVATERPKSVGDGDTFQATASDLGLSRQDVHEARQIRDAEVADPGVVRRTLDTFITSGREPTKAALRREVSPGGPRQRCCGS